MTGRPDPGIVDTHAHLDDEAFASDRDEVMAQIREAGVARILNIGYRPSSWESSRVLHEQYPEVSLALGMHPAHADEFDAGVERELIEAIDRLQPVAIGEAGFDFARPAPTFQAQLPVFQRQIEIALERRLPLIIHQRNAADALRHELDHWPNLAPIVLHSFDGDQRLTDWAIERGCYFGVGGLATRPKSGMLRDLLRQVPRNRLLLETDSPYLAPPGAPSRRNSPANLPAIAAILAPLWHLNAEALIRATAENAVAVFGPAFRVQ